jgi:hypothetical protein
MLIFNILIKRILHADYRLMVERWFVCTSEPESYAGGSVSS